MRIQTKLLISTATTLASVLFVSGWLIVDSMEEQAIDEAINKAQAVVGAAREAQEHLTELHDEGAIDVDELIRTAAEERAEAGGDYRHTRLFHSIPVIGGIEASVGAAESAGLQVTVTAEQARNPSYDPSQDSESGTMRRQLLKDLTAQVAAGGDLDMRRVDEETNTLFYMHAIRLEKSCMMCHGDPADSLSGDGLDPLGFHMENWHTGDVHGAYEVRTPLDPIQGAARASALGVAGLGFVFGLIGLGALAWTMRNSVGKPIQVAVETLEKGKGDLTTRLNASRNDELGQLGKFCNSFFESIQDMMKAVAQSTNGVLASASELDQSSRQLAESSSSANNESSRVAAAAEELSANVSGVGNNTQKMSASYRTVAAAVEEITASISEVATGADSAANVAGQAETLAQESSGRINQLGSAADEIGRVVETIQDIAEQTNLLALNATIEAARAGEAGKGFSVVANEVKDLARQTAEATQDIRKRIERIQGATRESVEAISGIDEVIGQVNKSARTIATAVQEQRSAAQEVAQNLAQNMASIEAVNKSVQESANASQEITQAMTKVDQTVRSSAASAQESQASAGSLRQLAEGLQSQVNKFQY